MEGDYLKAHKCCTPVNKAMSDIHIIVKLYKMGLIELFKIFIVYRIYSLIFVMGDSPRELSEELVT